MRSKLVQSYTYVAKRARKITVTPFLGRVVVTFQGTLVAETIRALEVKEANYPATIYVPHDDCKKVHFIQTEKQTKCPFKGTAHYWTLTCTDGKSTNAVWGYVDPLENVREIDGHLAFYPDRVDIQLSCS